MRFIKYIPKNIFPIKVPKYTARIKPSEILSIATSIIQPLRPTKLYFLATAPSIQSDIKIITNKIIANNTPGLNKKTIDNSTETI